MSSDPETVEKKDYDDSYANQINDIIDTLELESETDRRILKSRFLAEVLRYEKRKNHISGYNPGRNNSDSDRFCNFSG